MSAFQSPLTSTVHIYVPLFTDPPTYAVSVGGAVDIQDDDDDGPDSNMGDLTYTPMYTYVYDYRPPPAYSEVCIVLSSNLIHVYIFVFCPDHKHRLLCGQVYWIYDV